VQSRDGTCCTCNATFPPLHGRCKKRDHTCKAFLYVGSFRDLARCVLLRERSLIVKAKASQLEQMPLAVLPSENTTSGSNCKQLLEVRVKLVEQFVGFLWPCYNVVCSGDRVSSYAVGDTQPSSRGDVSSFTHILRSICECPFRHGTRHSEELCCFCGSLVGARNMFLQVKLDQGGHLFFMEFQILTSPVSTRGIDCHHPYALWQQRS